MEEKTLRARHDANSQQLSRELGAKPVDLETRITGPSPIDVAAQANVPWVTARIDRAVKGMKGATARQQARLIVRSLRAVYGDRHVPASPLTDRIRSAGDGRRAAQAAAARDDIGDEKASPAFRATQAAKATRALQKEMARAARQCPNCDAVNPAGTARCRCDHVLRQPKEREDGDQGRSTTIFR